MLTGRDRRDGALVVHAALEWLAENRDAPVFCFLHLYDLHKPYKLASYDAEMHYTDQVLGTLRKALIADGWWERSLVVLLSDHGESLGEHGEASHGYFIYQSTLAVPLIFHWPDGARPIGAALGATRGIDRCRAVHSGVFEVAGACDV